MNLIQKVNSLITSPKNLAESAIGPAFGGAALISIPLIAMQFSAEVNWDILDFAIAWSLIFAVGFTFQIVSNKVKNSAYKIATGLAAFASLAILWVNGAVGIIGNESNPLNLMFAGVLLMVILGSFIAKLEAQAMSRVMISTAVTQVSISFAAFSIYIVDNPGAPFSGVLNITLLFTVIWLLSALFYRRAGIFAEN